MGATQMEYKTAPFEMTSLDATGRTVEGYAAFFGNVDRVKDVIHPGAFRKTLAERGNKVKFLWQHSKEEPLGRIISLKEDARGLFMQAAISDTSRGRDVLALLQDGALDALSIGYDAIPGGTEYTKNKDYGTVRELKELRLWEVSLVTFGANEMAQVTGLKNGTSPGEGKPAPDVGENTIRWRVREPGDFEEDSFRTISIGDKGNGIQAVVGRLKGEDTTTIQTYLFDKEKFDVDQARSWVEEHEQEAKQMTEAGTAGNLVPPEQMCQCTKCDYRKAADSCDFECPECGAKMEAAMAAEEDKEDEDDERERYAYKCEKCGHELVSLEDAYEDECPVCGGGMKRKESLYDEYEDEGKKGAEGGGEGKAVWSAAAINDLPDSCFLYIETGGEKDDEGKTVPRSLRHFPYKDADGTVDLPHLRNAIARIPQSNAPGLTAAKKKALQDKARGILDKMNKGGAGPDEAKAGRVLAARNAERIVRAAVALIETLEDAGIDVPGFEGTPGPEDTAQMDERYQEGDEDEETPQAEKQAGTASGTEEAATPPTSKGLDDWALEIETLGIELELLEV